MVVVFKWSTCSPCTPTIWVRIPMKHTVFSCTICVRKERKNKKRPGLAHLKKVKQLLEWETHLPSVGFHVIEWKVFRTTLVIAIWLTIMDTFKTTLARTGTLSSGYERRLTPRGHGFESRHRIQDEHFHIYCCQNWNVCFKRPKINNKWGRGCPIFKEAL